MEIISNWQEWKSLNKARNLFAKQITYNNVASVSTYYKWLRQNAAGILHYNAIKAWPLAVIIINI